MIRRGLRPRRKMKVRASKASDHIIALQYLGDEPKWDMVTPVDDVMLGNAYNWYSYFDEKFNDAKKWTLEYLKKHKTGKKLLERIESEPNQAFIVIGWIARMMERGAQLPERTITYFNEKIKALVLSCLEKETQVNIVAPTDEQSVFSRNREKTSKLIAELDEEVDKLHANKFKTEFNPYEWMISKDVKGNHAKAIVDYYKPLSKELDEVLKKKDEQLKEAYSNLKKKQIIMWKEFIDRILGDAGQIAVNAKVTRKPRKRKVKSAEQLVAKMKYKATDDSLKIKSIHPTEIIGSQQLWVFNTKTRKLGLYLALNPDGLNIKGTTVQAFDDTKSIQKKVRKPDVILPSVTQGGKVALRKIMDDIKAKESPLTGRINNDTILLRVTK